MKKNTRINFGDKNYYQDFSRMIDGEHYSHLTHFIHNCSIRYLHNYHDAQEVSQDVLVTLLKKKSTFRFRSSIKTWVYRITVNTCLNFIRKKANQKVYSRSWDLWEEPDYCQSPEVRLEREEEIRNLLSNLRRLPQSQQEALKLYFLKGYSQKQVARKMHRDIKAVESLIQRGKYNIKKIGSKY